MSRILFVAITLLAVCLCKITASDTFTAPTLTPKRAICTDKLKGRCTSAGLSPTRWITLAETQEDACLAACNTYTMGLDLSTYGCEIASYGVCRLHKQPVDSADGDPNFTCWIWKDEGECPTDVSDTTEPEEDKNVGQNYDTDDVESIPETDGINRVVNGDFQEDRSYLPMNHLGEMALVEHPQGWSGCCNFLLTHGWGYGNVFVSLQYSQSPSRLTQTVQGLVPGETYLVHLWAAESCSNRMPYSSLSILVDGEMIFGGQDSAALHTVVRSVFVYYVAKQDSAFLELIAAKTTASSCDFVIIDNVVFSKIGKAEEKENEKTLGLFNFETLYSLALLQVSILLMVLIFFGDNSLEHILWHYLFGEPWTKKYIIMAFRLSLVFAQIMLVLAIKHTWLPECCVASQTSYSISPAIGLTLFFFTWRLIRKSMHEGGCFRRRVLVTPPVVQLQEGTGPSATDRVSQDSRDSPTRIEMTRMLSAGTEDFRKYKMADITECIICLETYNEEVMASCGHSFCAGCICAVLRTNPPHNSAPCPMCRQQIRLRDLRSVRRDRLLREEMTEQRKGVTSTGSVLDKETHTQSPNLLSYRCTYRNPVYVDVSTSGTRPGTAASMSSAIESYSFPDRPSSSHSETLPSVDAEAMFTSSFGRVGLHNQHCQASARDVIPEGNWLVAFHLKLMGHPEPSIQYIELRLVINGQAMPIIVRAIDITTALSMDQWSYLILGQVQVPAGGSPFVASMQPVSSNSSRTWFSSLLIDCLALIPMKDEESGMDVITIPRSPSLRAASAIRAQPSSSGPAPPPPFSPGLLSIPEAEPLPRIDSGTTSSSPTGSKASIHAPISPSFPRSQNADSVQRP